MILRDIPGQVTLDLRLLSRVPVVLRDGEYRVTSTFLMIKLLRWKRVIPPRSYTKQLLILVLPVLPVI